MSKPAVRTVTLIENTWTDIPKDVDEDICKLWGDMGFGNDVYYYKTSDTDLEDEWWDKYPALKKYIQDNEIKGEILIHYWW